MSEPKNQRGWKAKGWVAFRPEWREAECPRCEYYVNVGEPVFLKAQLGDGYVEVEHALCPNFPNPFTRAEGK